MSDVVPENLVILKVPHAPPKPGPVNFDGIHGVGGGTGRGVVGESAGGDGVVGISGAVDKSGVFGFNSQDSRAFGVFGRCNAPEGVGVYGQNSNGNGMVGESGGTGRSGVFGFNTNPSSVAFGVFGRCDSGEGVHGNSLNGDGVVGQADRGGSGVVGRSETGVGVNAVSRTSNAVSALSSGNDPTLFVSNQSGRRAAWFEGRVVVIGELTVLGPLTLTGGKSAAVPHPDGSHRLLYSIESPESWFEDFGEASLVDGKAVVHLDPDFGSVVQSEMYHVFVTPYGDSNGLYVANRYSTHFEVQEQKGGKSNVAFSYRVVAKRKDIVSERLAPVTLPERLEAPKIAPVSDPYTPEALAKE